MKVRFYRPWIVVAMLVAGGLAWQWWSRLDERPEPARPAAVSMPAQETIEPGLRTAEAIVADPGEPPALTPSRPADPETAAHKPAERPRPSSEDVITLTPTPIPADIEAYRARFQAAGTMELVNVPPLARALEARTPGAGPVRFLRLPIPGDRMLSVEVLRHDVIAPERGVFVGRVENQPFSEVIVSYYREAITASMILPAVGHYEVAYAGDGSHLLMDIDPEKLLPEAPPVLPPRYLENKENQL